MEWIKYTINTTADAEELITASLNEIGISGVEIEDKRPVDAAANAGLFGEVIPEMPEDDQLARISFYLDYAEDQEAVLSRVRESLEELRAFADIGSGTISRSVTKDEDWINNWKQYFHQFYVDDILIVPSWEAAEGGENAAMVLSIDPGTAFGTGKHETTRLAIRALRHYLNKGDRILDIGTGSGILGIVALKEGAGHVFGTDIDDNVTEAIRENLEKNDIDPRDFEFVIGNIISDKATQEKAGEGYDIVVSNIIAEILVDITKQAYRTLKDGGLYLTSGILKGHEDIVYRALADEGFEVLGCEALGDWLSIAARKKA